MSLSTLPSAPIDALSPREAEVLALVCHGLSNEQIAQELYVSQNTVKTYVRGAYRKMDVDTRARAVIWGLRHGYGPALTLPLASPPAAGPPAAGPPAASPPAASPPAAPAHG